MIHAFLGFLVSLFLLPSAGTYECRYTAPPDYYTIDLLPTKRVPEARRATGVATVTFASSPFGIAVSAEGHYIYTLNLQIDRLRPAPKGTYTAWVVTPNLDQVQRLGPLSREMTAGGQVSWNKFLVVITLEPSDEPSGRRWRGPVVLRGMSRSGFMHTMAGHGPFQQEPCATFGYY